MSESNRGLRADNAVCGEEKKEDENDSPQEAPGIADEGKTRASAHGEAPPRQLPSFYAARFRRHFGPAEEGAELPQLTWIQRYAASMARRPWTHMTTAFVVAVVLSVVGFAYGDFKVAIDNAGWWSRGTLVSNRASQEIVVGQNRAKLFYDETGDAWEELQTVVQPNWQTDSVGNLVGVGEIDNIDNKTLASICSGQWYGSSEMVKRREKNLVALWKTDDADSKNPEQSALEADAMYELCVAEESTLRALDQENVCHKCDGKCISPYSLVLLARLQLVEEEVTDVATLSEMLPCDDLRSLWTPYVQETFTTALDVCVNWAVRVATSDDFDGTITIQNTTITVSNPCSFPVRFLPTVVDEKYPTSADSLVRYTSSYYATKNGDDDIKTMYDQSRNNEYDHGDEDPMVGVYDTAAQNFYDYYSDAIVGRDMSLAVGSAGVTALAMLMHTKSPFLTMMGLFQIILSFPLAYFVYYFMGGIVFFPFLNFIGIFVVFALGADDVFVAVDKFKAARHELPFGSTEQIATLALPDAAYSMLLTSLTTTVAFFGTAICPVGPIVCFAVFCGLLISLDYLMCLLLVFPALCLYDKWLLQGSSNKCVSFEWCCGKNDVSSTADAYEIARKRDNDNEEPVSTMHETAGTDGSETEQRKQLLEIEHTTLIHRVLDGYYTLVHRFRWGVLLLAMAGFVTCVVFAARLTLPTSSEVALLPESNEYEQHRMWSLNLLSTELAKGEGGSVATITWGVTPADTGDHLNPASFTTLVLDPTFSPRTEIAQEYLLSFCERLYANDFASSPRSSYLCPINQFDEWLKDQSSSDDPSDAYTQNCAGTSSVPVASDIFDPCIISWSKLVNETSVLSTEGRVKIMEVRSQTGVFYDSPFSELKKEWDDYEAWLQNERSTAPAGVNQQFHSDVSFWWYDTNRQMLRTAYGAAGIALLCAAVVLFVSSKSFILTLFAGLSILYVLLAATASLVGLGWELGFLESILFAILIGISCDFVIHFGHAYTMYSGAVNRHYRTNFAITHMGPSILAAAFTTFMAAVVMVFTEITFFRKFAVMLFMTIIHSTIGCFVVFVVLCDCFGPAEPTKGYQTIKAEFCGSKIESEQEEQG